MEIQYLEIVTNDVDAVCEVYSKSFKAASSMKDDDTNSFELDFSPPNPKLGNARTLLLRSGTRIGVRPPMHDQEEPVVRPYIRVANCAAAMNAIAHDAKNSSHAPDSPNAFVMVPPMTVGDNEGICAIAMLPGGFQAGFWQITKDT
jgi:uncharacterized protein